MDTQMFIYKEGLKEAVGVQVHLHLPTTLEDMIVLAERVDKALMTYNKRPGGIF